MARNTRLKNSGLIMTGLLRNRWRRSHTGAGPPKQHDRELPRKQCAGASRLLLAENPCPLQLFLARMSDEALALRLLTRELANSTNCFGLFSHSQLRRFFVEPAAFHFPKRAFALHLFL